MMSFSEKHGRVKGSTSLRAGRCAKRMSSAASVTVEAALALPLFIFFFVNILTLFNILAMECNVEAALHQTGTHMAVHAADLEKAQEIFGGSSEGAGSVLAVPGMFYAAAGVREYLGKERLSHSCITDGADGITFWKSRIMAGNDLIDLVATYRVHPLIRVIGFQEFTMESRYFGHVWNGYEIGSIPDRGNGTGEQMVYVTETGTVYHTDSGCSYLKLSIRPVSQAQTEGLRSIDGSRYYPCEECGGRSDSGTVYLTDYGNRYHNSLQCPGLKRTISVIPISQVGGRLPCSKCGSR